MKKYTIYYEYVMCGEVVVEAESLDEAMELVEDNCDFQMQNEDKDSYVDSSFEINKELTIDMNKEDENE